MWRPLSIGALFAGVWLTVLIAAPDDTTTVNGLIDLVRSSMAQKKSDKALARSVHKLTLSRRLDLRTMEELESEGAGPETLGALEFLYEKFASRPASTDTPPFKMPARPSVDQQRSIFHEIDLNAIHYTRSLPNFICTEVVHRYRYVEPRRTLPTRGMTRGPIRGQIDDDLSGAGSWTPFDVLTVKLSYFENREKYELTLVNGRQTRATYESTGGAISEGDFGSVMLEIFSPDSGTKFQWDHWTHLRKRLTRVYSYYTAKERSHYRIGVGEHPGDRNIVIAGRRGFVYADAATSMVMRITGEAESIPVDFPVLAQSSILDYDYGDVGGKQFLLPLRVQNQMKTARIYFKNVAEFKEYRKFTGESSISFDSPDSAPREKPQP